MITNLQVTFDADALEFEIVGTSDNAAGSNWYVGLTGPDGEIKALDLGVADAQKKSDIGREIASVGESEAAKPAIKHIKSSYVERNIASVGSAQKYYLKKIKRSSLSSSAHGAQVRVIGLKNVSVAQDASSKPKRDLASLKSNPITEIRQDANLSEFLKSYQYHQGQQHKHSSEVQRLIDDLKSY